MARNSRALFLLGLVVLMGAAMACGKDDKKTTTAPITTTKELNSPVLTTGARYQHTFTTGGTYAYHCTIHPNMQGVVVVDSNSVVAIDSVTIINSVFGPASVTVAPHGTVTWTNRDTLNNHTVTSD